MRRFTTLWVSFVFILASTAMIVGCLKDTPYTEKTEEVHEILKSHGIDMPMEQIEARMAMPAVSPCTWDFDMSGNVDATDLLTFLEGYGTEYLTDDLLDILIVYDTEYIVDVIPLYNDWIQDVNCALDWDNFPKVKCGDTMTSLSTSNIEVEWILNGEVVSTDPTKMDWKTYGLDGGCNDKDSYQPPCNGYQEMTQRIYYGGHTYERVNVGNAHINIPDSLNIPDCDLDWEDYLVMPFQASEYGELDFLIE